MFLSFLFLIFIQVGFSNLEVYSEFLTPQEVYYIIQGINYSPSPACVIWMTFPREMQHTRETQPQPHTLKRELSIEHNDSTNVQFGEQWVFIRVVKRSMHEELLTKSRDDAKAAASLESTPLSKWWLPQTRARKSRASRRLQGHNISSFLKWGCLESPLTVSVCFILDNWVEALKNLSSFFLPQTDLWPFVYLQRLTSLLFLPEANVSIWREMPNNSVISGDSGFLETNCTGGGGLDSWPGYQFVCLE